MENREMKKIEWIKEGPFWVMVVNGVRTYRDQVYNDLTKIVHDIDTSDWAVRSYKECAKLLLNGKRWHDDYNTGLEAPNRWVWYPYWAIMKLLKIPSDGWSWQRPQTDMTRDPYYALGACCMHFMRNKTDMPNEMVAEIAEAFLQIKLPWYIFRFSYYRWKRGLINDKRKPYVIRIDYYRQKASVMYHEVKYKETDREFYENSAE